LRRIGWHLSRMGWHLSGVAWHLALMAKGLDQLPPPELQGSDLLVGVPQRGRGGASQRQLTSGASRDGQRERRPAGRAADGGRHGDLSLGAPGALLGPIVIDLVSVGRRFMAGPSRRRCRLLLKSSGSGKEETVPGALGLGVRAKRCGRKGVRGV